MSRCDDCRRLIDTDDCPEACTDDGYLCEGCREPWTLEDELALRADNANDESAMHGEQS